MTVRFEKTPKGEVAILPRKEYEALISKVAEAAEDAGAARVVARAKREIDAGLPMIPKAIVDRLAAGEHPVRVFRDWRDVTHLYLAHETGLSQSYISDLESGRRKGAAKALRAIAKVLDVPLDLLTFSESHRSRSRERRPPASGSRFAGK